MKFEVNKFLALTALLASATAVAAGCSSTDAKKTPGTGGEGGDAGSAAEAGSSGNTTSEAGATSPSEAGAAGAGEGGAAGSGEGGAAGAVIGACIGDLVGAAGAADESTPCDALGAAGAPDCGAEALTAAQVCFNLYSTAYYRPSVVLAYNSCATALANSCDEQELLQCAVDLIGQGCAQETTPAACALVKSECAGITKCAEVMDLATPAGQAAIADCMDPASENFIAYTPDDCDLNLRYCAGLPVPALPTTL